MVKMKTATALSLAVLIAFGVTSCTPGTPSKPGSSESSVATNRMTTESVRLEALKTFSKIHDIRNSREYGELYKEISRSDWFSPDVLSEIKKALADNADMVTELNSLISVSDKNKEETLNLIKAYSGQKNLSEIEDVWYSLIDISVASLGTQEKFNRDVSYEIIPGMVQEKDGDFSVTGDYLYIKDKNDAVIGFLGSETIHLALQDGGKKIVFEQEMEGVSQSTNQNKKPAEWYILQSDVKNAATNIETWAVSQKGRNTKIVVRDNHIVDEFDPTSTEYEFRKDDGTKLTVEGTANAYIITGTYEGLDETFVYDSVKGGLQDSSSPSPSPTATKEKFEPGVDYMIWKNYSDLSKQFGNDTIDNIAAALNKSGKYGASYEVVEKNGTKYIKVNAPESKISKTKDFLLAYGTPSK